MPSSNALIGNQSKIPWPLVPLHLGLIAATSILGPAIACTGVFAALCIIAAVSTTAGFAFFTLAVSHIADLPGLSHAEVVIPKWTLVLVTFGVILAKVSIEKRRWDVHLDTPEWLLVMFILWHVLCSINAIHSMATIGEALRIAAYPALVVIVRESLTSRRHLVFAVFGYVVVVLVSGLYTVLGPSEGIGRWAGLTGNANSLGLVLSLTIPSLIAAWSASCGAILRSIFFTSGSIGVVMLLLTGSRSALLGLVVQGIVAAVLLKKTKVIAVFATMLLAVAVTFAVSPPLRELGMTFLRLNSGTTHRTLLWSAGMDGASRSPIFGHGAGLTVGDVVPNPQWGHSGQAFIFKSFEDAFGSHNLYVTLVLTLGVPGLLLFVSLIWALCRHHLGAARNASTHGLRVSHIAVVAMVVGALCSAMFESMLVGKLAINNYFWIAVGIVAAYEKIDRATDPNL